VCAIQVTGAVTLKSATPYLHTAVDRPGVRERRTEARSSLVDVDGADTAEGFELPGADLSGEELSVRIVAKQADEFTCSVCFLVHHRHRYAGERAGLPICRDCAA